MMRSAREIDLTVGNTEMMKNIVAKGIQTEMGTPYNPSSAGYVTEKLYMLLQLYLQNKGWNHEFHQIFSELKDPSIIPSAAYLQMMASRIILDNQGRLVLRENGKIILPFEHFANAVMLKHMNGPHGLHLGLEATLRTVMESYTMGRENFGMEKEFVIEVVNNCPNPACRFYKTHLDLSHTSHTPSHSQTHTPHASHSKPTYIPEPSIMKGSSSSANHSASVSISASASTSAGGSGNAGPSTSGLGEASTSGTSNIDIERTKGTPLPASQNQHKLSDFLKSNLENLDSLTSANKDLLAVHNGSWLGHDPAETKKHTSSNTDTHAGQEKIVRAFSEIMRNMTKMKTCIRPSMCKPYGKQSEALQKTLMDTIQLVQSLRSILPPPHIAVSSWKNEDKHGLLSRGYNERTQNSESLRMSK